MKLFLWSFSPFGDSRRAVVSYRWKYEQTNWLTAKKTKPIPKKKASRLNLIQWIAYIYIHFHGVGLLESTSGWMENEGNNISSGESTLFKDPDQKLSFFFLLHLPPVMRWLPLELSQAYVIQYISYNYIYTVYCDTFIF